MNENVQRPCPACKSSQKIQLGKKNGFMMLICRKCRSIYSSHLPLEEEDINYDEYYTEQNLQVPAFILKRLDEIITEFQPFFTHGKFLDIGFGAATILQVAQEKGWDVNGIEVSASAVEHAGKLGFEVFHGELQDAEYPDNHFDVITASEIIEHCPQPEILLDEVIRILRPGGLFWATTPSAKGISFKLTGLNWTELMPPEHIQLYSKKGIQMAFKKSGFSKVSIKTFGFNPFEIVSIFHKRLKKDDSVTSASNAVETSYKINEGFTKKPSRQKIKNLLNGTLNFLSIGDSLKIKAVK